ncbi:mRNA capping enzyme-domain-containing protein [Epithele typhae]|uniref:mRNA capping enzyme-domain-containing protein n=1 Tax=Epithele typhae TaxID=378194 RepID=UPI0020078B75|nr:mRNA capping enzyme-domain-containing protein [Epithele typhae]KAH9923971.1 mRNA capping enzyme-domain-containing protein [Epithele typhae]
MPAFDPVRDAVLNSPIASTHPLPASARMHHPAERTPQTPTHPYPAHLQSHVPPHPQQHPGMRAHGMSIITDRTHASFDANPSAALVSPLTRRATDLSMLLNSDPAPVDTPLFTPTTPRAPATLSHLLHSDTDQGPEPDQLAYITPLRRRSSAAVSDTSQSYFTHPGSINNVRRASSSSVASNEAAERERFPQPRRESFGLSLPGAAAPPTVASSSAFSFSFPSGPSSRPSTGYPTPSSRPSTSGQPSSGMPPPQQTVYRSPPPAPAPPPAAPTPPPRAKSTSAAAAPVQPPTNPTMPPKPHPTNNGAHPSNGARPKSRTAAPAPPPPVTAAPSSSTSSLPPPSSSLPQKPMPPPSPPPSTSRRSAVPYAPLRVSPAASVLVPLSPAEMDRYRNYAGGVGAHILRKRKRVDNLLGDGTPLKREQPDGGFGDEGQGEVGGPLKKRRTGDVAVVVQHYNARPDVGVAQRQDSPIIGLKSFNNWVKSVLITRFAHPALAASPGRRNGRMRGRVLDMGCGKGGDLTKWAKANVAEYVGLDIAQVSVDQARGRHGTSKGARFTANFFALDCYTHGLADELPAQLLATPFDVVSLQFCMHYAFESERKARTMLANVATWLRPGGVFIGTVPDADQLMAQLDALPAGAPDLSWGNAVYRIRFEDRAARPVFGHRYWFFLQDAVDDVPEYVVHWENFVGLAAEYGLHCVYKKEFHQIFEEHQEHPEFAPLLQRMRVVDANGESHMDEDQWEAANIYVGFAFEKR